MTGVQMEYDLGGFSQVIALEERRREALPDLSPSDLINIALQKYRCGCSTLGASWSSMPCLQAVARASPYTSSTTVLKPQLHLNLACWSVVSVRTGFFLACFRQG